GEVEAADVCARVHFARAELDGLGTAGNLLPDTLLGVERARLVYVAELHGLADAYIAGVGLLLVRYHPEERRLPRAVRADDTDDASGRELERQPLDEQAVAVSLRHALGLYHDCAEARAGRYVDFKLARVLLVLLGEQSLVG